ncbi:MAG: VWA domain-containing protein [Oligoflexia bacterium]|nr:VWA domain-containing protein [Oligoflexia bacterium]
MLEHFVDSYQLLFLLLLPPGYLILLALEKRRAALLNRLGISSSDKNNRLLLPLAVIAALVAALARPHAGFQELQVNAHARDIMLVVDVSKSMLTKDVEPNRLEFAKRKLVDLLGLLPTISPGDRVGIVLFAGESYRFLPLTSDYQVVRTFISAISPQLIRQGGSSLKAGLQSALDSLRRVQSTNPLVLLVSDGEDLVNAEGDISTLLRGSDLTLSALGIGTLEGKPIDLEGGYFLKDNKGNIVVSKLREDLLMRLCATGRGGYVRARLGDSDLRALIAPRNSGAGSSAILEKLRVYRELGPYVLWLPLIGILALVLLKREQSIFALAFITLLSSHVALAEDLSPYHAQQRLHNGDYKSAEEAFAQAVAKGNRGFETLSNLATSEHRLGKFREAAKHFSEAAQAAQTGKEMFEALYNSGTASLFGADAQSAELALEEALKIKPGDEKASKNLEIARAMKKQQTPAPKNEQATNRLSPTPTPQASPSPDQQDQQQKQQQDQQQENGSSPNSESSPTARPEPSAEPSAAPSAEATATAPIDNEKKDTPAAEASPQETAAPEASEPESSPQETPLGSDESKAWLESLDDSPVLLKPKQQRSRVEAGQTW